MANKKTGAPSKYESKVKPKLKFIRTLIQNGYSQEDVKDMLGISKDTFYTYKKKHKEFSDCLEKENLIDLVENTYINRLIGKYKATREIFKREVNEEGTEKMVLDRIEKYEVPFNDGAYARYLAIMRPKVWGISSEAREALDLISEGINLNIVNGNKDG